MPLRHFVNLITKLTKAEEHDGSPQDLQSKQMYSSSPVSGSQLARTEPGPHIQPAAASPRQDDGKSSIFFARVPPTVTPEQLLEVFSCYGHVVDLNLFRPFAEAKTSKGCGIVRFSSHAAARLAKEQLHGQRKFNEDGPAMVVEWVNEGKLRVADKAGSSDNVFIPKSHGKMSKSRKQASTAAGAAGLGASGGSSSNTCSTNEVAAGAAMSPPTAHLPATPGTASRLVVVATDAAGASAMPALELPQQLPQQPGLTAEQFVATNNSAHHLACSPLGGGGSSSQPQQPSQMMSRTPVDVPPWPQAADRTQPESIMSMSSTARHYKGPGSVPNLHLNAPLAAAQQHQHQQPDQLPSMIAGAGGGAAAGSVMAAAGQVADLVQAVQSCCLAGSGNPSDMLVRLTGHEAYVPTFRQLAQHDMQMLGLHTGGTQQRVPTSATDRGRIAAYSGVVLQDPSSGAAPGSVARGWGFQATGQMPCTVGLASAGWSPAAMTPMNASMMAAAGASGFAPAGNQPVVVAAPVLGATMASASNFVLDASAGSSLAVAAPSGGVMFQRTSTSGTGAGAGQLLPFSVMDTAPLGLQTDTLMSHTSLSAGTGVADEALCAGVGGMGCVAVASMTFAPGAAPTGGVGPASGSLLQDSLGMQQQLQQQQQQLVFCQNSSIRSAGGVASAEAWSGPAIRSLPELPEEGHLQQDDNWLAHCGSGYFDMQTSSSAGSHLNVAVSSSNTSVAGWTSNSTGAVHQRGGLMSLGRSVLSETASGSNTGSFVILQQHQVVPAAACANTSGSGLLNLRVRSDPSGLGGLPSPATCAQLGTPASRSLPGQGFLAVHAAHQQLSSVPADAVSAMPSHAATSTAYMSSSQSQQQQQRHQQQQQQVTAPGELVRVVIGSGPAFVSLLAENMASVSQLSGAMVSIDASLGELMVWLSGTADQVTAARRVVQLLLDQQQQGRG